MEVVRTIARLFREHGADAYFGEPVTQEAHALQCAALAVEAGASETLIVAAVLHDIGHLVSGDESLADAGIDGAHEDLGARWLAPHFPPEVTEPVRLHVPAKRYLCAVDPAYSATLSDASVKSLALQGGPMSVDELGAFDAGPHADDALRLRRWDDQAKVVGLDVPPVESYLPLLERIAARWAAR